jgi:hypothetical protein
MPELPLFAVVSSLEIASKHLAYVLTKNVVDVAAAGKRRNLGEVLSRPLGGCYLDGFGHSEDLFPAGLAVMSRLGVLLVMLH